MLEDRKVTLDNNKMKKTSQKNLKPRTSEMEQLKNELKTKLLEFQLMQTKKQLLKSSKSKKRDLKNASSKKSFLECKKQAKIIKNNP